MLALVLAGTAVAIVAAATRAVLLATRLVTELRRLERQHRAALAERGRILAARTSMADAASGTTTAVQVGSMLTKASHRAIADVPFGIFDAIPPTQAASRRIRRIHDGVTDGVYDTIAGLSGGIGALSRRRLLPGEREARQITASPDGSDPPAPLSPPGSPPG